MNNLVEWLSRHAVPIGITATLFLIANALLLVLNPKLLLQIMRYTAAALSAGFAVWNVAALTRK